MLRALIVEVLRDSSLTVVEASDGMQALDLLRQDADIALLISDVKMPGMDGYGVAEAAVSLRPTMKIILMTGYGHEPPVKFLRAHEIEVWTKPFDLDLLAQRAKAALE